MKDKNIVLWVVGGITAILVSAVFTWKITPILVDKEFDSRIASANGSQKINGGGKIKQKTKKNMRIQKRSKNTKKI
jgi:hypothetical protein